MKQVEPTLLPTDTRACVAEFYKEGKALGSVDLVLRVDMWANRLGIAFRRARPDCQSADEVRFFNR